MNKTATRKSITDMDEDRLSDKFLQEALKITDNCHSECVAEIYHALWAAYVSMN